MVSILDRKPDSKKKGKQRKGQIFTFDSIIGLGIFIAIIISMVYIWDYTREKAYYSEQRDYMERAGRDALSSLVLTSGSPPGWHLGPFPLNSTVVESLGLARNRPLEIDQGKAEAMQAQNSSSYMAYKEILGLEGLEFRLTLWPYSGGYEASPLFSIGTDPPASQKNIVKLQRFGLLHNSASDTWLRMDMEIWERGV